MLTDTHYFFWGGICSQWMKATIVIDGVEYNCNEQYMMAEKARLFNDHTALEGIMKFKDPSVQKAIGRKVNGFEVSEWTKIARLVVYRANLAKFSQHPALWSELVSYGNVKLVEASPQDVIWGIGLHESDPDCLDETKWRGLNWLGIAIMQARADITTMRVFDRALYV